MKAIFACDAAGGMGFEGHLPWPKVPGDLAHFKNLTLGQTVIMGRGTYESTDMPVPLPLRKNIVLSRSLEQVKPGMILVKEIDDLARWPDAWLIGGASLIQSAWSKITKIHLTFVKRGYECDCRLSLDTLSRDFSLVDEQPFRTHSFQIWDRKCSNT